MATVNSAPTWWGKPEQDVEEKTQILYETIIANTGVPINSLQFKAIEGGWRLMVKARSAQRGALICFYEGRTWGDCLAEFFYACGHRPGVNWKKDRYAD